MIALRSILLASFAMVLIACASPPDGLAPVRDTQPSPELTARQVVQIQLQAFGNNNAQDEGIEIGFRFASPRNREQTGPLPRFVSMLKAPAYGVMLEHDRAEYAELVLRGGLALQRVRLIRGDTAAVYDFYLRRYELPGCDGCWMTEAVYLSGAGTMRDGQQTL
jgi:hypothetical protein